jgi:hypothetical protein
MMGVNLVTPIGELAVILKKDTKKNINYDLFDFRSIT